mmetsp:Transcript_10542/g.34988  ORF Transcript_10542/g.34988 Transcript_10542/m.34988 type:complete len:243 (+) Transcript_10542:577-1305(+)
MRGRRTPEDSALVPVVVDSHPREPLRLVVQLSPHVEVDGEVRPSSQHFAQEDPLLPARLTVAGAPEAKRKEVVRHSVQLACLGPILEDGELTGPREAERSPRECDGIRLPERALGDNGRHVTEQNVPVDPSPVGELSNLAFKELAVEGLQVAQSLEGGQLGGGLRLRSTESRHESPAELVRGYMQVLYVPVIDGGAGWCCVRVGGVHRKQSILWRIALVRGDQVRPPRWEAVHDEHQQANAR